MGPGRRAGDGQRPPLGPERRGGTRVDPATGRAAKPIVTARNGYRTRSFAVADGDLWVQTSDGRLVRLDGATGRRKAAFHVPDGSVIADLWSNGLYVIDETTLSRVDPNDLRPAWRAPIVSIGPAIAAGGRLWVETPGRRGDRVLTVDPRTGRVIDSVARRRVRGAVDEPAWL